MTDKALLLIDLQNDYFPDGRFPLVGIEAAAANAAALLAGFRAAGLPVIHIRHEILRKPAPFFAPGSPGADIHPSLAPVASEPVITKNFPNSFRETGLGDTLSALAPGELVIAGAMSHFCIDATTRAAADMGYQVTLAHDACATRDLGFDGVEVPAAQVHAAFMAALANGYARLLTAREALP